MTDDPKIVFVLAQDEAVRDSLKFVLELYGLNVATCASGLHFLTHRDLPRASCLVLEHHPKNMNSFDLIETLAEQKLAIPVILIVDQIAPSARQRAMASGVKDVIEKPFVSCTLSKSINRVLGSPMQRP